MKGDIINFITAAVAAGVQTNYQPATQIEWVLFGFGGTQSGAAAPNRVPNLSAGLTNGTNSSTTLTRDGAIAWPSTKLGATNLIYIWVKNDDASSANMSISGVQTK